MKFCLAIAATILLSQIVYAEESSSIDIFSESSSSLESTLYYNTKDYAIRKDYINVLNSELDRLAGFISDLHKGKNWVFENEIGRAPIQQLEDDDNKENNSNKNNEEDDEQNSESHVNDSFDFDSLNNGNAYVEFSLGGKNDPLNDELNDLDRILNNVLLSVEGLLSAILNPIIGDRATGRPGILNNLVDKLGRVVDNVDDLLEPHQPRRPSRSKSREDDYDNKDLVELDFDQNKQSE